MIGNHAIPVIADAYLKGFTGFDAEEALTQMVRSSRENHINSNWTLLNQYGYYPFDSLDNEAVSRTLEHGVDDYCIALMAEKIGKKREYISALEKGQTDMQLSTFLKIADALGLRFSLVLG